MPRVKANQVQAKTFSAEEIAELRSAFEQIDTDKSGKLDLSEIQALMTQCDLGPEMAQLVIRVFDEDHDGAITFEEFANFISEFAKMEEDPTLFFKLLFRVLDADGSGFLEANEIVEFVNCFSEEKVTINEAQAFIDLLDTDHDNKLSFEEVLRIFESA